MSDVAFQTSGVSPGASSTTIVIVKPVGLTAGNMMVAAIFFNGNGTITPPSGFALISGADLNWGGNPSNVEAYWKVADAGDAAASNFTFTVSGGATENIGAMLRLTGADTTSAAFDTPTTDTATSGSADTTANPAAHTFVDENQLLVLIAGSPSANTWSQSVAGSNQTLTERVDINTTAGTDCSLCIATVEPDAGQTNLSSGVISLTRSAPDTDIGAIAFMVRPTTNATVSLSTAIIPIVANDLSVSITKALTEATIGVVIPTLSVSATTPRWSNSNKNTVTANSTSKHTVSVTNASKNTVSVINTQKS